MLSLLGWPPLPASLTDWDFWNGLGLAAALLLVLCCWAAPATQAGYQIFTLRLHISFAVLLVAGVTVHALGMLLTNNVAVEYLKWRAPLYMHAGNVGFVLMLALCLVSVQRVRRRLHTTFNTFRLWHRALSVLLAALVGWHVLGSGFLAGAGHAASTAWQPDLISRIFPGPSYWRGWALALLLLFTTAIWWRHADRPRGSFGRSTTHNNTRMQATGIGLLLVAIAGGYTGLLTVQSSKTTKDSPAALPNSASSILWVRDHRQPLPVTFAHADHVEHNCVVCHHNFTDDTGQGFCYDCHKSTPDIVDHMEAMFHGLCRDCHVELARKGDPHGPVRACQQCHLADLRP